MADGYVDSSVIEMLSKWSQSKICRRTNKKILDKQQNYDSIYFFIVDVITNMMKNKM
jgi:hypothetical protein